MKKKISFVIIVVLGVVIAIIILKNCLVLSTDLSTIKLNSCSLGENISELDFSDGNSDKKSMVYNDVKVSLDDAKNIIQLSTANDHIELCYNDIIINNNLDDYKKALGGNCKTMTYDYSQLMYELIYTDKENNVELEIIYIKTKEGKRVNKIIVSYI